jgi:hypothetical protein
VTTIYQLIPAKTQPSKKCLYSLRVWLRHQFVDQRIFADDALWVGTDPDFAAIPDAIYATVPGIKRPTDSFTNASSVGQR